MTFVSDPGSGNPVFDYSSRDYQSVLADLLARQQIFLPEWTSQSNNDFGVVLLEEFAYVADILGYYMDRLAGEAFIQTATQPQSILNLAAMLGYTPYLSSGATTSITVTISSTMTPSSYPVDIVLGSTFSTAGTQSQPAVVFTTTADLSIAGSASMATPTYSGTVDVVQGVTYNQTVATSNGSINQVYPFTYNPVSASGFSVFVDLGTGPQPWTFVSSLLNAGPFDLSYTNFVDANGIFYVVFGDGVNGYVPPLGSPISASYRVNNGVAGNVGLNTIVSYLGPPAGGIPALGIVSVTNPAASGGAPAETIASIQQNAPASLRTLQRGVTVQDITTLAQNLSSSFLWAAAIEQTYQLVNLYMVPVGGGPLSALQVSQINYALDPLVMANTTLTVLSPTYVVVNITVSVVAFVNYSNSAVQQAVENALTSMLALGNTGLGFRVALGLVYETVDAVAGVNYSMVSQLQRGVLVTTTSALVQNTSYISVNVTGLPQNVNQGDTLVLTNTAGTSTQTLQASASALAGAFTLSVGSFSANAAYPVGSTVVDNTLLTDVVTLPNEIPIAGTFGVTVTGGTT